jgi:phosphatidate cytidylyltransferase
MLKTRIVVGLLLLPIGVSATLVGGFPYYMLVTFVLVLAAWEYVTLFKAGGYAPAGLLVIVGVLAFSLSRVWNDFSGAPVLLSALVLLALVYHLLAYERGVEKAGTDYGITLAGILHLGWIGAYLISIRKLPFGEWWLLLALPVIWSADVGAYFVGSRLGKHKLSPRVSPRKTWEGYIGGVVTGIVTGGLLGFLYQGFAAPGSQINVQTGLVLGLVLASTSIFGDLGESMFKRQVGLKDSGTLLPGHGGVFDRIDSWLWGGVIGFYIIQIFIWLG